MSEFQKFLEERKRTKVHSSDELQYVPRRHHITMLPSITPDYKGSGGTYGIMEADGTRYIAWIYPVRDFSLQMLGHIDDGFLVISGLFRTAYLLHRTTYLDPAYLMEKFGGSITDAENFKTLLLRMNPEWK